MGDCDNLGWARQPLEAGNWTRHEMEAEARPHCGEANDKRSCHQVASIMVKRSAGSVAKKKIKIKINYWLTLSAKKGTMHMLLCIF